MKRRLIATAFVAVSIGWLVGSIVSAQDKQSSILDQKFAQQAALEGKADILLGKIATEQATNASVRRYGQRMVTEHTAVNDKLMAIAEAKNIAIPDGLTLQHQQVADRLATLQGDAFDAEYMQHMIIAHEKAIERFSEEAKNGQDTALRAFAAQTLPRLKAHLHLARDLAKQQMVSQAW